MFTERPRLNSHRTLTVQRVEDNGMGPTPQSNLGPTPIRSLKRKQNFHHKKPSFRSDEEPCVEDVGDLQIQDDRPTFEIRTRDKSDLEEGEPDLEVRLTSSYKDDESGLGDDKTVLEDDESDLEEFPIRNNAFANPSRFDYVELTILMFDSWESYGPSRWALLVEDHYLNVEDCYQLLEGPTKRNPGKPYEFRYEPGKLGSFRKPDRRHHITWIRRDDRRKVYHAAKEVNHKHKFSQRWVIEIIWNLEEQRVVVPGKGHELRVLEQKYVLPKEKVDNMLLVIEQETARSIPQKLSDWVRGRPGAVLKTRERVNCKMVELVIFLDPEHKYRLKLQNQTDSKEDYYARLRNETVQFFRRADPFGWFTDGHEPISFVCEMGCPRSLGYGNLYFSFAGLEVRVSTRWLPRT
ncbi:uncharacterized protein FIESC28_06655 [Fusarium coffeatum]|uniref:Uncharacterized protein n=1 Tax=Fusarium coffeatum TaxID=231269 RepID=A0A366RJ49_9HYPO|nr:uncharacterized protein FIESC28_06655 [Fusarium coffeatum]RBR17153.1 hypothetical protein FIESC28_06655 [Fusarium coffeatum]